MAANSIEGIEPLDLRPAPPVNTVLTRLRVTRFRVHFNGPVTRPDRYAGSAWRGALGSTLRRQLCTTGAPNCIGCPEAPRCTYPLLFETAAGPAAARGKDLSRPFWLQIPWPGEDDSRQWVGLTVAGVGRDRLTDYLDGLRAAGREIRGVGPLERTQFEVESGLGKGEWRVRLEDRGAAGIPDPGPAPSALRIMLDTPLRLRHHGKTVRPDSLTAEILVHAILSRLQSLLRGAAEPPWSGAGEAVEAARGWMGERRGLTWEDWTRFSSRQDRHLEMGGLRGELALDLSGRPALWPLLWAGQWLHCGKGTTMGLGRYSVHRD